MNKKEYRLKKTIEEYPAGTKLYHLINSVKARPHLVEADMGDIRAFEFRIVQFLFQYHKDEYFKEIEEKTAKEEILYEQIVKFVKAWEIKNKLVIIVDSYDLEHYIRTFNLANDHGYKEPSEYDCLQLYKEVIKMLNLKEEEEEKGWYFLYQEDKNELKGYQPTNKLKLIPTMSTDTMHALEEASIIHPYLKKIF
jgi:hypothetical protein